MKLALPLLPVLLLLLSNLLLQQSSLALPLQSSAELKLPGEDHILLNRASNKIFHPSSGFCVLRKSLRDPLKLGPCTESDKWSYTPQKFLVIRGTYYCLQVVGSGQPVKLSVICSPSDSQWMVQVSDSKKTHLTSKLADGNVVCLDVDSNYTIISNPCNGFSSAGADALNSDSQWFKLITTYRKAPFDTVSLGSKLE